MISDYSMSMYSVHGDSPIYKYSQSHSHSVFIVHCSLCLVSFGLSLRRMIYECPNIHANGNATIYVCF